MILHARWVSCVLSLTRLRSVAWFCSLFRWMWSEKIYVLTFSILIFTFLKMSVTWRSAWFWRTSSLHFMLDNFSSLSCWCHMNASNVIFNLITAEYICLVFMNVVFHVKTSRWLSISILMTWSASICWRCESYWSFMFSWTSRIYTSNFNFTTEFSMHRLVIMLNLFDLRMKCVNLYFSEANVMS